MSSVCDMSIVSFPDDNLGKSQWIFIKLGLCIDIVVLWLGLLMGKSCQILIELSAHDISRFSFLDDSFSNVSGFLSNLDCALTL